MFLQATVDAANYEQAQSLLEVYRDVPEIDIIEMGAPMVTHYGVEGAKWFHARMPLGKKLYVDTKLIDFPELELMPFIHQGLRYFSAAAIMNDTAFQQLSTLRVRHNLNVLVTLMGYPLPAIEGRVMRLQRLGFNRFIAHGAGGTKAEAFRNLMQYVELLHKMSMPPQIVAAGGIDEDNCSALRGAPLEGIIVGRGIAGASDPRVAARTIIDRIVCE